MSSVLGAIMSPVTTRRSIHALVDALDEGDLSEAKHALEEILAVGVTEEARQELLERVAECDRGEAIDAREFLAKLRGVSPR